MYRFPFIRQRHHFVPRQLLLCGIALLSFSPGIGAWAYGQAQTRTTVAKATHNKGTQEAPAYKVTYTITESDAGKRLTEQYYAITVSANGPAAVIKVGTKDPFLTGGYLHEGNPDTTQFQFTYVDVGLNISAQVIGSARGLQLITDVGRSVLVNSVNPQLVRNPTLQQNEIKCSAAVKPGIPVSLASYDIPDSTRHFEIQAVLDRLP